MHRAVCVIAAILLVCASAAAKEREEWVIHTGEVSYADAARWIDAPDDSVRAYIDDLTHRGGASSKGDFRPIAGIVSHHGLVGPIIGAYFSELRNVSRRMKEETGQGIKRVILLGPDHFKQTRADLAIGLLDFRWEGRTISIDRESANNWNAKLGLPPDRIPFFTEHSIFTIVPFIKHAFPDALLVPVIINPSASSHTIDQLADILAGSLDDADTPTIVLTSIDFAHHLNTEETNRRDVLSFQALLKADVLSIQDITCDSPKSVQAMFSAIDGRDPQADVIFHTTNEDFLGVPQDDITSYFFVLYYGLEYGTK